MLQMTQRGYFSMSFSAGAGSTAMTGLSSATAEAAAGADVPARIAIAVDYCMKELSFHEQSERSALIKEGFTYGSRGSSGLKKVLNVAMGLVEEHANDGPAISRQVRASVEKQLSQLNTSILGDFFSKNDVARTLFTVAKEFEQLAMAREFASHGAASIELRSTLFCLLDYWGIDRVMFSEALEAKS
jgi:hypothetical protein